MPQFLRYRYQVGKSLKTQVKVVVLVDDATGTPEKVLWGTVANQLDVLEEHPDGSWTVRVSATVEEQGGNYPPLEPETIEVHVNKRGELLGTTGGVPRVPIMIFPNGPVVDKFGWQSEEKFNDGLIWMEHTVKELEKVGDDTLAHMVSEGMAEGDLNVHIFSVRKFSIKKGQQLDASHVINYSSPHGPNISVCLEESMP